MGRKFIILLASAAALYGCAPKPEPVTVEPVYTGKYGAAVGGSCRPAGRLVDSAYPASVPDCPQSCAPGTSQAGATASAPSMCVPDGGGDREPNDPGRSPNDPTGARQ